MLCSNNYPDFWIHSFFFKLCSFNYPFFFLFKSFTTSSRGWLNRQACKGWIPSTPLESEDTFSGGGHFQNESWFVLDMRWTCIQTQSERERCLLTWNQNDMQELLLTIALWLKRIIRIPKTLWWNKFQYRKIGTVQLALENSGLPWCGD